MSDKTKYTRINQDSTSIPYIDDKQDKPHNNATETTGCINSSCESLPTQAPLVRQPRCSIDIDTTSLNGLKQGAPARKKGICEHQNPYLDNMPLRESVQELP